MDMAFTIFLPFCRFSSSKAKQFSLLLSTALQWRPIGQAETIYPTIHFFFFVIRTWLGRLCREYAHAYYQNNSGSNNLQLF